ncbi:MAG TPA: hypothetical protein VG759_27685 [Candidatus Angelobacter sp.]|jgi:hypothetical protein|nr:hypothetical protein [Candidatus Angelobacter sp.]
MSRHAKSWSILKIAAVILVSWLLAGTGALFGQVIKVEAGASDILPSQGGSINIQGENYEGYLGAGDIGGVFRLGSYVKTSFAGYKFTLGDQTTVIGLPTDIFGSQQYFLTRGAAASGQFHGAKVFLFGGATALGVGSQFFQAAQAQVPVGMLFLDIPLSDKLVFYSRNLGSTQQTSIQGLSWHPWKWLTTGVSAGIGGNQPYAATTLSVHQDWLDLRAGYIQAGDRFRRITTPSVFAAEPDRENILVTVKPLSSLVLIGGHENLLQPQTDLNAPFLRATVDQFQSSYTVAKFRLGAGVFQSRSQSFHNVGEDFSISRSITRNIEAGANYFHTVSGTSGRTSNLSGTVREKITQKLSLLQVVTRSAGNTNVLFGGSYTANRFAVSVDYQTIYLPFLPTNPFQQGLSVSLRMKLFGNFQVSGDTFRSSDGKLRYSAGASTLLVHNFQRGGSSETFSFPRYIVRGHVRDEGGAPIEGAALRIGDELVYTNALGEFMVRQKKAGQLLFEVVLPQFQNALPFRVVAAPPTVTAEPEDSAHDVLVVLSPAFKPRSLSRPLPSRPTSPAPAGTEPATTPEGSGTVTPQPKAPDLIGALRTTDSSRALSQRPTPTSTPSAGATKAANFGMIDSTREAANLLKYVIRGRVQDTNGVPLAGFPVPIGDEVVFTNAKGEFIFRQKKPGLFVLGAALQESMNSHQFRVIAAPSTVFASPEDSGRDVVIVLGRPDRQQLAVSTQELTQLNANIISARIPAK